MVNIKSTPPPRIQHSSTIFRYISVKLGEKCIFLPHRAALNAGRSSREKGVCLSVCLSVKRVYCDKTEGKSVQIFTLHERTFNLVL